MAHLPKYPALLWVIDTIFPPRPDERVVRGITDVSVTELLFPTSTDAWTALARFQDTRVRALMHEAKYEHNTDALRLLGLLFSLWYQKNVVTTDTIILPIPLAKRRLRERGYNQVSEVLRMAQIPFVDTVLVRVRDTKRQTELTRIERTENMHGAFRSVSPDRIQGKHIIIVDDVVTTGATFKAAREALVPHAPASIRAVAFAH